MTLDDEAAAHAFGRALGAVLRVGDVVALAGPLGAGKTTVARGILAALGLAGEAASPSYPVVIAYAPPELAFPVAHVDLYRIERASEFDELGLDDLRADGAVLLEWPERMGDALWPDALRLALAPEGARRRLTAMVPAAWESRWPPPPR
jgi:tRNA threonylcarbamoyladenosine biosynthesis protein TsaE